ncbi:MAG TPA: hypothetical protein VGK47_08470 [Nitrososphaeraceae archaeon]
MESQPIHIERAELEIREMFSSFRGPNNSEIVRYLNIHESRIDWGVAWEQFNAIAFRALFAESSGETETLQDPIIRRRIMARIRHEFVWRYYTTVLVDKGIMDCIETDGVRTYFFKGHYKESMNILFMDSAAAIRS